MKQSKRFKSYKEAKEYIESLTLEEHIQFCQNQNINALLETESPVLSFDDDDIPVFEGSFDDMVQKYNALTPDKLMGFATSGMKQKLKEMER